MTQETVTSGDVPVSTFQVTHYMKGSASSPGWSQVTTAEVSSADAIAFITKQAAEAADLGFGDPVAEVPADPTPAPSADVPTGTDASTAVSGDAPADGEQSS